MEELEIWVGDQKRRFTVHHAPDGKPAAMRLTANLCYVGDLRQQHDREVMQSNTREMTTRELAARLVIRYLNKYGATKVNAMLDDCDLEQLA